MKFISRFAVLIVLLSLASIAFTQPTKPASSTVKPALVTPTPAPPDVKQPTAADVKPTPLPTLTEVESLKLENLQMKFTLLSQQQQQLQQTYTSLIQTILAEHPGYTWDAANSRLMPIPKSETPAKK